MLKITVMKRIPKLPLLLLMAGFLLLMAACTKEYSLEFTQTLAAQGSLQDSLGTCIKDSVVGTYYNGVTPGRDTAYVEVAVNVTRAGSYNITSTKENGIYFSDSGYFTTTGINTIKLKPVGAPTSVGGPYDYSISFDSTTCYFSVSVKDSTGTGLGGHDTTGTTGANSWQFTSGDGTFSGTGTATMVSVSGFNVLGISGATSTGDSLMGINISLPSAIIPSSGTYKTTGLNVFSFSNTTGFIYEADASTSGVEVTITITSYDSTTKELKGTYAGTAKGSSGTVTITNGSFDVTVQ